MNRLSRGIAAAMLVALPLGVAPVIATAQDRDRKTETARDEKSDQTLREAITQLEQIKSRIHASAHIYGGHRGKADQHIDQAVAELQAALKYDEKSGR